MSIISYFFVRGSDAAAAGTGQRERRGSGRPDGRPPLAEKAATERAQQQQQQQAQQGSSSSSGRFGTAEARPRPSPPGAARRTC